MYPTPCLRALAPKAVTLPRQAGLLALNLTLAASVFAGNARTNLPLDEESDSAKPAQGASRSAAPTSVLPVALTPTRYDFFEAANASTGLTVTWRTIYERGLLSFDLYRRAGDGGWRRVNADAIPAGNAMAGGVYRVTDPTPAAGATVEYKLVEWDEACEAHDYGPVVLRVASAATALPVITPPPPRREPKSVLSDSVPPVAGTNGSRYAKFSTRQAGLYCVRADTIAAQLGQPLTTVQQALIQGTVGLYSRGQGVGFIPAADGSALYFYATAYGDNYGSQNVFWLTGLTNPAPAVVPGGAPAPVAGGFDQARFLQETNALAAPSTTLNPEDDYWFWRRVLSTPGFNTFSLNVPLSLVVTNQGSPRLKVILFGGSSTNHGASVTVNGNLAGTNTWSGLAPLVLDMPLQPEWLKNGNNTLLFTAANVRNSQWYLNKLELYYPRLYQAASGMLEFGANSNPVVTVEGFTAASLSVLDVTDPLHPALVSDFTVSGSGGSFSLSLTATNPAARYFAFQAGATVPEPTAESVVLAGLASSTNAVEFVLIAPAFLAAQAEDLAAYRRLQGLPSQVVTVESIYNEFSDGLPSPYSLREFLARAYTNWASPPKYVALVGDGSFDYRNLLGYNQMQVPTLMLPTSLGLYASDSLLSDFNGDNIPEMGLGRLPVRNATQLLTLINKIKAYEAIGLRTNAQALLVADFPDGAGNFVQDLLFVAQTLSNKYAMNVVWPTTTAALRSGMISNLNAGTDLMVYLGHGALDRFGQAGYLISSDVTNLVNGFRLPLVSVMTCVAGEYSQPGNNCIGEELVLAAHSGAIAVIAPTGLSANQDATLLNQRLMRVLRTQDWGRLGDFWRQAAADYSHYDQRPMGVSIYNLLGDPSLKFCVSRDTPPSRRK
jgi:hypothetical protein